MSKELEELKQEYLKDPITFIKECDEKIPVWGAHIKKVMFIEDTEPFTTLSNNLEWWNEFEMDDVDVSIVHSKVEDVVYISNRITLKFKGIIGVINLTPKNDGISLSKIILNPNLTHKKGTGSVLMGLLYKWMLDTFNDYPPMYLECMGRTNWSDKMVEYPYSLQTKFFRKFGFRVIEFNKGNNELSDYCQMKFFKDKLL